MLVFALQAGFIALVGRYSMAFDEYYHLGTIQLYAKTWLPWHIVHPTGPAHFGAITTDGSYLYHYLMSFPYRVLDVFISNQTAQIIALRLIDVAIVVAGFYVFRRVLRALGMTRGAAQAALVFIMFIPVTTFLAGQLTYDALFFTCCGLAMLPLVRFVQSLDKHGTVSLARAAWTAAICLVTLQVKYAFAPIIFGAGVYIVWLVVVRVYRRQLDWRGVAQQWRKQSKTSLGLLAVGVLLLTSVFFLQRYGMNLVRYNSLTPDCDKVLSVTECLEFDPYGRDAGFKERNLKSFIDHKDLAMYPYNWFTQMIRELYFTVGPREVGYAPGAPLPSAYITGYMIAIISIALVTFRLRAIISKGVETRLLLSIVVAYIAFLFAKNLSAYVQTGVPVAIHGRYILPLLPLMAYGVYVAVRSLPKRFFAHTKSYQSVVFAVLFVATLYGGGIAPYIIRSNDSWQWPKAVPTTRVVRSIVWPITWR